jgi:hypothetical protein
MIQIFYNLIQLNLLVALAYFQFKTSELLVLSNNQTMELKIQLLKQEQKMEALLLKNDALSAKLSVISSASSTDSQYLTWVVLGGVISILFLLLIKSDEDALIQFAQMMKKNTEEVLSSQEAIRQGVDHVLEAVIPSVTSETFKVLPLKTDMTLVDELIKAAMG